jgi:hypothetical protein
LVYLLGEYATEWALVRGTSDCGVLNEKRTDPNTNIEGPKWNFGPISCGTHAEEGLEPRGLRQ